MKDLDFEGAVLLLLGIAVAIGIFWGVTTAIRKSFQVPSGMHTDNSVIITEKQTRFADDTEEQRRRMIRDQQQKMRDYRRKAN